MLLDERVEAVAPEMRHYAFNNKTVGQRAAVIAAGPIANFIFAIFAYWLVFIIGVPGVRPVVGEITPNSVAAQAQIAKGTELKAIDGIETPDWDAVRLQLVAKIGNPQTIVTVAPFGTNQRQDKIVDLRHWSFEPDKQDPVTSLGISKDSENEVSDGAGGNHRRTLTDGFIVEGIVTHLRRHRFNTLIQHLDVAAQWDQGDDELCAGTEFVIALIPLGGYVKMLDERVEAVAPEMRHYAFNNKTVGQRAAVIAAGPIANFIFAIFAYPQRGHGILLVWLKRPVPQIDDFILALIGPERGDGNYCLRVADFGHQLQTHRIPIRRFDTIYRFKFRSFCNLCLRGNRIGRYFTHHRPHAGNADDKDQPVSKDSENEVSDGAGGNHRRTLTDGFIVEGVVTHLRRHRFNTLIQQQDPVTSLGIQPRSAQIDTVLAEVQAGSAAQKAGLQAGDRIVKVDGQPLTQWMTFVNLVRDNPGKALALEIERQGSALPLTLTPDAKTVKGKAEGFAGVVPKVIPLPEEYKTVRQYGPFAAIAEATDKTWQLMSLTVRMGPLRLFSLTSPVINLPSILTVSDISCQVLSVASAMAANGPY